MQMKSFRINLLLIIVYYIYLKIKNKKNGLNSKNILQNIVGSSEQKNIEEIGAGLMYNSNYKFPPPSKKTDDYFMML